MNVETHSSSQQRESVFLPLEVEKISLYGVHIIEASAGTGKTYNISRIYLRCLLEKQLSVSEILVVTFTKAATEEIKARVASTLADFLVELEQAKRLYDDSYDTLLNAINTCRFEPVLCQYLKSDSAQEVHKKIQNAKTLLRNASITLDEASIYTIHGFCQRVMKLSAFQRQDHFEPNIIADNRLIILDTVRDFYRGLVPKSAEFEALQQLELNTPEKFIENFRTVFETDAPMFTVDQSGIKRLLRIIEQSESKLKLQALLSHAETDLVALFEDESSLVNKNGKLNRLGKASIEYASLKRFFETGDLPEDPLSITDLFHKVGGAFGKCSVEIEDELLTNTVQEAKDTFLKQINQLIKDKADSRGSYFSEIISVLEQLKSKLISLKSEQQAIDYNDMISMVAAQLSLPNKSLIDYLQGAFPVALIDEFQDTDAHQYTIFDSLYCADSRESLLLMIGDPKQAIYGFRGGDINTYQAAVKNALKVEHRAWTLNHNYRSNKALIDAYNFLFTGAATSEAPDIQSLQACEQRALLLSEDKKLANNAAPNAVRADSIQNTGNFNAAINSMDDQSIFSNLRYEWIRAGKKDAAQISDPKGNQALIYYDYLNDDKKLTNPKRKRANSVWLANEIKRLLSECKIAKEQVKASDIAVLVRSANEAKIVRRALQTQNIPSVYLSNRQSIFEASECFQLLWVLQAILHPNKSHYAHPAFSTELLGLSPEEVIGFFENRAKDYDDAIAQLFKLKELWQTQGIYVLVVELITQFYTPRGNPNTRERAITNFLHLAEMLQEHSKQAISEEALLDWLRQNMHLSQSKLSISEQQEAYVQRLESDSKLVKIVTLHGSKGLQYPIVFIPFSDYSREVDKKWSTKVLMSNADKRTLEISPLEPTSFDLEASDERELADKENTSSKYEVFIGKSLVIDEMVLAEEQEENLRLLYVGITRAETRCYIGRSNGPDAKTFKLSPYNTLIGSDGAQEMATRESEHFACFTFDKIPSRSVTDEAGTLQSEPPTYLAKSFSCDAKQRWSMQSFSKIAHGKIFSNLLEKDRDQDQSFVPAPSEEVLATTYQSKLGAQIPQQSEHNQEKLPAQFRFSLVRSAETGNLIHNLLEHHDFTKTFEVNDDNPEVRKFVSTKGNLDCEAFSEFINEVLQSPVSFIEDMGNVSRASNNANESAGLGETDNTEENGDISILEKSNSSNERSKPEHFTLAKLAKEQTLREPEFYFTLSDFSPKAMVNLLRQHRGEQNSNLPESEVLDGMMHGFIDLIFEYEGKYYIADYKSNHLGDQFEDYQYSSLLKAMKTNNYDLQALIYMWVLHLLLEQNLPNYQIDKHLGGYLYLFVRGMSPKAPIDTCGVFYKQIDGKDIAMLQEAFASIKSRGTI